MDLETIFTPTRFDGLHVLLNMWARTAYDERVVSKEDIFNVVDRCVDGTSGKNVYVGLSVSSYSLIFQVVRYDIHRIARALLGNAWYVASRATSRRLSPTVARAALADGEMRSGQ